MNKKFTQSTLRIDLAASSFGLSAPGHPTVRSTARGYSMDHSILSYASSHSGALARCSNRDYSAPCGVHPAPDNLRRARMAALVESRRFSSMSETVEFDTQLDLIEQRAEPILARLAWEAVITEAL
jgi:hypothetical protein